MDTQVIIAKHRDWKNKFRVSMCKKEMLNPDEIGSTSCCDFGKWLAQTGKELFGASPEYQRCLEAHAEFHKEAKEIALKINANEYLQADKQFQVDTPYSRASVKLAMAVTAMFATK